MPIEWTEELSTGIDEIDNQHKELFKRINSLLDACRQGRGKDEVGRVMRFMEDYVKMHFSTEEKLMAELNYPAYAGHKGQHLEFMNNFNALKRRFNAEGPRVHIVIDMNRMLVDWLLEHIKKLDKSLARFMNTRG